MNSADQFFVNDGVANLFIAILNVQTWYRTRIGNSESKTLHCILEAIPRPSTLRVRLLHKSTFSRIVELFLHRRLSCAGRETVLKDRKPLGLHGLRPVLIGHECSSTQRNAKKFHHSSFVLSIVSLLFSVVSLCPAQQARATQASLQINIQTFQQVEDRWSEAINKRDQYALGIVLSPELIDISASGEVRTRNQRVAMLFQKGTEPLLLDRRVVNVRIFGDLAVVIGTYVEKPRVNEEPARCKGMFTHIYQNVRGNWLCVNAHSTAAAEPSRQKLRGAEMRIDAGHLNASGGMSTQ
jgi:hypothetical protein